MATRVEYNGVVMHNVMTRRWSQDILMDQSDTDQIGSTYSLAFDGVIHAQREDLTNSVTYTAAADAGSHPAAMYDRLKIVLSQPRKALTVLVDGNLLLQAQSMAQRPDASADIDNGPTPTRVELTSITGNNLFRVRFEIDVTLGLCSPGASRVVLSNRWSLAESMDERFFTQRTINGRLRVAHGVLGPNQGLPPHAHKHLVVPMLETGFKRVNLDFSVEENGLECTYRIVDRQVHTAAPWPATKIEARHSESSSDGVKFHSAIHVRLQGPPSVDKRLLIERAVQIAENRLNFIEPSQGGAEQMLEYAEIVDTIGEEATVELVLKMMQQSEAGEHLTRLREDVLGTKLELPAVQNLPEYDPTLSPVPAIYGYDSHGGERRPAVLWLLHCYLQEPCSGVHDINAQTAVRSDDTDDPSRETSGTTVQEQPPHALIPAAHQFYRDEARRAIYTFSKVKSEYTFQDMKVAMPIARRTGRRSQNAPTNVVFDLSEPQAWRKVVIDAERITKLPEIMTPLPQYSDGTLVATRKAHDLKVYPPSLTPDGRHEVFRVQATIWYTLNRPPTFEEQLRIGSQSYTKGVTNAISQDDIYNDELAGA